MRGGKHPARICNEKAWADMQEEQFQKSVESGSLPESPAVSEQRQKRPTAVESFYEWMEAAIFSLVLVTLVFSFLFRIVGVDGESMMNTLMDHDRLILRSAFYTPEREDIVVIYRADNPEPLIKRVIAVGGDTVRLDMENNAVYRNGELLDEPYIDYPLGHGILWDDDNEVTVPEGKLFVLGDHRNDSKDSRDPTVMFVDVNNVMGEAVFRLYPFDQIGGV